MAGSLDPDRPGQAIASRAKDDGRQRADELVANLRALADTVNQPANGARARYVAALEEQREELEKWLNRYRPEPREPAEGAGEAGDNADQPGEGDVAGGNPPAGSGAGDGSDSNATGG
jgi:ABC-type transporter Mla subunit MlaD